MNTESPAPPPDAPPPSSRRPGWLTRGAIDLGDVVVQIFAVVVGILLALLINDWSNQRQQQTAVDEAVLAIRAELAANRAALHIHATRMFAMAKDMLDSPDNRNQPPRPCYHWEQWRGIGGLNLVDAAYQTSITTQALANMHFKQAQLVSQIYGWQHYYQKGFDLDTQLLMENPQTLDFCVGVIEDLGLADRKLGTVYIQLIGPDKATWPTPRAIH